MKYDLFVLEPDLGNDTLMADGLEASYVMGGNALMCGDDGALMSGGVGLLMSGGAFMSDAVGPMMSGSLIPDPSRYITGPLYRYF